MRSVKGLNRGMTLVEVMVVVAIMALLAMLTVSAMGHYFQKERRKACVESIAEGIKAAQNYALKGNVATEFNLGASKWSVVDIGTATTVQEFDWSNMNWCSFDKTGVGGKNKLIFNGLGRLVDNANSFSGITTTDGDVSQGNYDWRVEVNNAIGVHTCLPHLTKPPTFTKKTDPRVCRV